MPALALSPTLALGGCLRRLGLVDRVVVVEKSIEAVTLENGEERELTLAHKVDTPGGPTYERRHDVIADEIGSDEPLAISDQLARDLESTFLEVRYVFEACTVAPVDEQRREGCRSAFVVREDFTAVGVGDVVDVRFSDDGVGLLEVAERREERT